MQSDCVSLDGSVRISDGRTDYFHDRVLQFDYSRNRVIRVQTSTVPLLGLFFFLAVIPVCLRYIRSLIASRCPRVVAVLFSCICSSSTRTVGAGWGTLASLAQLFAFISVGWCCGSALVTLPHGFLLVGYPCWFYAFVGSLSCVSSCYVCGGCAGSCYRRQCCQGCGFFPTSAIFRTSFGDFCSCLGTFSTYTFDSLAALVVWAFSSVGLSYT